MFKIKGNQDGQSCSVFISTWSVTIMKSFNSNLIRMLTISQAVHKSELAANGWRRGRLAGRLIFTWQMAIQRVNDHVA